MLTEVTFEAAQSVAPGLQAVASIQALWHASWAALVVTLLDVGVVDTAEHQGVDERLRWLKVGVLLFD